MGHRSRAERALALGRALNAEVFIDESEQPGPASERRNGDVAWRVGAGGDWTVVVQDDALPVEGFRQQVSMALAHAPRTAVGLYFGSVRPEAGLTSWVAKRADAFGASWIEWDKLAWGVGVAMPTDAVEDFLDWAAGQEQRYDRRIGEFWKMQRIPIRYTWPSLVDHDDELPSVAGHRSAPPPKRVAYRVGTREDWGGPTIRIGAVRG